MEKNKEFCEAKSSNESPINRGFSEEQSGKPESAPQERTCRNAPPGG